MERIMFYSKHMNVNLSVILQSVMLQLKLLLLYQINAGLLTDLRLEPCCGKNGIIIVTSK